MHEENNKINDERMNFYIFSSWNSASLTIFISTSSQHTQSLSLYKQSTNQNPNFTQTLEKWNQLEF